MLSPLMFARERRDICMDYSASNLSVQYDPDFPENIDLILGQEIIALIARGRSYVVNESRSSFQQNSSQESSCRLWDSWCTVSTMITAAH